jgi:hypothetical protein
MITSQNAFSAVCALANVLGVQMGLAGIKRLQEMPSIPFYQPDGMYKVFGLFWPMPPNWLVLGWAHTKIAIVSLVLPLISGVFLIPRGHLIKGWLLLSASTLAFAGTGVWIWLHAVFNAEVLSGV